MPRQKHLASSRSRAPEQVSYLSTKDIILDYLLNSGQNVPNQNWPRFTGPMADYLNPEASPLSDTPGSPSSAMVINRRNLPRMLETWAERARRFPMRNFEGEIANPENVAAQAWLETVAPRFSRQVHPIELTERLGRDIPEGVVDTLTYDQIPGYLNRFAPTPEMKQMLKTISEDYRREIGDQTIGFLNPRNKEIVESIGGLSDANMWMRVLAQDEKAGKTVPEGFFKVRRMKDAARDKFMKFLDLLVEEKGPSEASEILTNIGKRE